MNNLVYRIGIVFISVAVASLLLASLVFPNVWRTPDQRGQRLFDQGEFVEAAATFRDARWRGIAEFRAGNFADAEHCFAQTTGPDSIFNRANCLVMLGKYEEAIEQYDLALKQKPGWPEAENNRSIAIARAAAVKQVGGDAGDQRVGADEIVFDQKGESGKQDTEVDSGEVSSDADFQATWLKRVQTKPAEFLKSKFAYQVQFADQQEPDDE